MAYDTKWQCESFWQEGGKLGDDDIGRAVSVRENLDVFHDILKKTKKKSKSLSEELERFDVIQVFMDTDRKKDCFLEEKGMGNEGFIKIALLIWLHFLTGYESVNAKAILGIPAMEFTAKSESEKLLDAFLSGEIPAVHDDAVNVYEWLWNEEVDSVYSVGERVDLDGDGENEQVINGPYGGRYLDARNGKVYVLAEGEGTAGVLFYTNYDNAVWIVHSDTTHMGRQMYWLTRYDGDGNIVDCFQLSAEYWDSPDSQYDENSDFTYRDEKISMEEYEALRDEILSGKNMTELYGEVECTW